MTTPVSRLRLALVGAGRMGSTHARAAAGSDAVELVAVVEPSDVAAAAVTAPARRFRDVAELVDARVAEAAVVAVPTRLHVPVVSELLEAGLPVLCEKPLGLTASQAEGLGHLAGERGLPLRVGYWRRFVPELRALRARVSGGALGELQFLFLAQWDERPPPPAFRDPASSGGILVDMAVHELDAIRWLTGQEPVSAAGYASPVCSEPPVAGDPESMAMVLRLSAGALAVVSLIRRHPPGEVVRLEAVGTTGAVRLEPVAPPDGDERLLEALRAQLADFAAAARGEPSEGASAADAAAVLRDVGRLAAAAAS